MYMYKYRPYKFWKYLRFLFCKHSKSYHLLETLNRFISSYISAKISNFQGMHIASVNKIVISRFILNLIFKLGIVSYITISYYTLYSEQFFFKSFIFIKQKFTLFIFRIEWCNHGITMVRDSFFYPSIKMSSEGGLKSFFGTFERFLLLN